MKPGVSGAPLRSVGIVLAAILFSQTALSVAASPNVNPTEKLSARLAQLSQSPAVVTSAAKLASTLDLPEQGPGSLLMGSDGTLVVNIRVARVDSVISAALERAGARITFVSAEYRTMVARVAPTHLLRVAAVAGVENLREEYRPLVGSAVGALAAHGTPAANCGAARISEGDGQMRVAQARQIHQMTGAGITVGVLSDSFADTTTPTSAAQDIAAGDLPGAQNPCGRTTPVQVLGGAPNFGGSDEGRAMLHIVHDLAPDANLAFATAAGSELAFADNIGRLRTEAGARVLVDDILYLNEPMFQDGPVTQAINDVTASGALYFTSAGNSTVRDNAGNNVSAYEAPAYRPAPCPSISTQNGSVGQYALDCHNFNPAGTSSTSAITLAPGGFMTVVFQWAEPRNGVATDLDCYIIDSAGRLLAAGVDTNNGATGTQEPFELLSYRNPTAASQQVALVIGRASGAAPRLKYVFIRSDGIESTQFNASNSTDIFGESIYGHAGAAQAISTAAVPFDDPTIVEPFSSIGSFTSYFGPVTDTAPATALPAPVVVRKPDVAATDGNQNTFFGARDGNLYRFYGTSAAAPHGAAVAALMLQYAHTNDRLLLQPLLEPLLEQSASPVPQAPGEAVGGGLINAEAALALLAQQPPPQRTYLPLVGR